MLWQYLCICPLHHFFLSPFKVLTSAITIHRYESQFVQKSSCSSLRGWIPALAPLFTRKSFLPGPLRKARTYLAIGMLSCVYPQCLTLSSWGPFWTLWPCLSRIAHRNYVRHRGKVLQSPCCKGKEGFYSMAIALPLLSREEEEHVDARLYPLWAFSNQILASLQGHSYLLHCIPFLLYKKCSSLPSRFVFFFVVTPALIFRYLLW